MQEKKTNVLSHILCAFQKKKNPPDDILTAADKVIESYIAAKNRLIHRKCRTAKRNECLFVSFACIFAAGTLAGIIMLFAH